MTLLCSLCIWKVKLSTANQTSLAIEKVPPHATSPICRSALALTIPDGVTWEGKPYHRHTIIRLLCLLSLQQSLLSQPTIKNTYIAVTQPLQSQEPTASAVPSKRNLTCRAPNAPFLRVIFMGLYGVEVNMFPCPSWPFRPSPKEYTTPLVDTVKLWYFPAAELINWWPILCCTYYVDRNWKKENLLHYIYHHHHHHHHHQNSMHACRGNSIAASVILPTCLVELHPQAASWSFEGGSSVGFRSLET